MTLKLSPETWAHIRYEYEYTDKPVDAICLDHGVSATTLRDRVRRWRWTPRHEPVPAEGPPAMLPVRRAAPLVPAMAQADAVAPSDPAAVPPDSAVGLPAFSESTPAALPTPHGAPADESPPDPAVIVPRLQASMARVLPAIAETVAKLAAGPMPPREMERAARTLTALTRTLRELNEVLGQYPAPAGDRGPANDEEFILEIHRKLLAFKAARDAEAAGREQKDEERG